MGGSSSKSTVSQLTSLAVDVVNKNVQSCVSGATQSQLIKLHNIHGDVKLTGISQKQGASVNLKCVFTDEVQNKMQNDIAEQISNFVKSSGGDLTSALGGSDSDSNIDIKNYFKTNIHNETVSKQVSTTMQQQTISAIDVDGSLVISDLDQEQSAKLVAEAIVTSSQYNGVLNTLAEKIDASSSSEEKGIFNSMFGMFGDIAKYVAIAVVVGAIALAGLFIARWGYTRFIASSAKAVGAGAAKAAINAVPAAATGAVGTKI